MVGSCWREFLASENWAAFKVALSTSTPSLVPVAMASAAAAKQPHDKLIKYGISNERSQLHRADSSEFTDLSFLLF